MDPEFFFLSFFIILHSCGFHKPKGHDSAHESCKFGIHVNKLFFIKKKFGTNFALD